MDNPEAWIRSARLYAAEVLPWFAQALYAAPFVVVQGLVAPAAIDRRGRVYFSHDYLQTLRQQVEGGQLSLQEVVRQLAFLWYHEVAHWLREHAERAGAIGAPPLPWNIAADLEINDEIPKGLAFPSLNGQPLGIYPRLFRLPEGKIAEWYYEKLHQPQAEAQEILRMLQEARQEGATSHAPSQEADDFPLLDEGSGVHGHLRPWESSVDDTEIPGLSEIERQEIREAVAHSIREHWKGRGRVPGGWQRWAETLHKPGVKWQDILRRAIGSRIAEGAGQRLDYSFQRPHRRSVIYRPLYLPALRGTYQPRIACVIDTSGSIGESRLRQALTEVQSLLQTFQVPVTVIPCDSQAYGTVRLTSLSQWPVLQEHLRGGGGTDMRAGLEAALQLQPEPTLILIFTDGDTPYPEDLPRKSRVLWVIWKSASSMPPLPPMPPWRREDVMVVEVSG